jgi:hypothetical protein
LIKNRSNLRSSMTRTDNARHQGRIYR